MEDKLRCGTTLIVDRYSYSGVAFSSAKELDLLWCKVTWSLFNAYYLIVTVLVSIPFFFFFFAIEVYREGFVSSRLGGLS